MIFPTAYLPSIFQLTLLVENSPCSIEHFEHFSKQTYRNRCEIYGANGKLSLSIPLQKWKNHSLVREIKISYADNWQKIHWKSIESAYRTSPYFEFYEADFVPFYQEKLYELLIDFNAALLKTICELMGLSNELIPTTSYEKIDGIDWRKVLDPKNKELNLLAEFPTYIQVFQAKYGFIPNLSAIDLLFNLGPQSKEYIQTIINTKSLSEGKWQKR